MKRGATDFVSKPWSNERLLATVRTAASLRASRAEVVTERGKVAADRRRQRGAFAWRFAGDGANLVADRRPGRPRPTSSSSRETAPARSWSRASCTAARGARAGSWSRSISARSPRICSKASCFGHVKGAFTDARGDRIGRMQAADKGTLFLDEDRHMPLHMQPKLLTALEQRQVVPVGANKPVPIDVRVIAATNCPPEQLSDEGPLPPGLLFRLNTVEIDLPRLRERREDIIALADHFIGNMPGNTASPRATFRRRRPRARSL